MASRLITDLLPPVASLANQWLEALRAKEIHVLVYCTWRSADEQDTLYSRGRTVQGPKVTNARGWQSWHQMRRAWDAVPVRSGKLVWTYSPYDYDWEAMIDEADRLGIAWGGRWHRFFDPAHWQVIPDGLTLLSAKTETLSYEESLHIV